MSYSLEEPEWPPVCECTYDEIRDEVFRGNCPLHYEEQEDPVPAERKPPNVARRSESLSPALASKRRPDRS